MAVVYRILVLAGCLTVSVPSLVRADEISHGITALQNVGRLGEGHAKAQLAAETLRKAPISELPRVLSEVSKASPVGQNWLRGVVRDMIRRSGDPAIETLVDYFEDDANDPIGRAIAIELIERQSADRASSLLSSRLHDPSLLVRERAVAQSLSRIKAKPSASQADLIDAYQNLLAAARQPRQVSTVIKALRDLGEPTTAANAFKMLTRWHVVAPFDNHDGIGFDHEDPPEIQFSDAASLDLTQSFVGKHGTVAWQVVQSEDDDGRVDLAKEFDNEKGATAYAFCEFVVDRKIAAQVRLGTVNANKVWVNGYLAMSNHVYHSGEMIDQYIADIELNQGVNRVLLKICQNEQTQPWAQAWEFQIRLTDRTGKGLVSQ